MSFNLPIEVDPRLNDHRSGFEGEEFIKLEAALKQSDNYWTARFNGGESIEDIKDRIADFLSDLQSKDYDTVLIVSSQWVIRAMIAVVQGISNEEAWKFEVTQASCTVLEI